MEFSIYQTTKESPFVLIHRGEEIREVKGFRFDDLFTATDPLDFTVNAFESGSRRTSLSENRFVPPIGSQEIWAAGVTYFRSRTARMEEAEKGGGDVFYDKVYEAERPELFFKSTAARCRGHEDEVCIRRDSSWDVPEPELTLAISSHGQVFGYTVGNDMSSRSIEGENPLYLPQAKLYAGSCALGPCLVVGKAPPQDTVIDLRIARDHETIFTGSTRIDQIKRSFEELAEFLFRSNEFPLGAYLMTGTGIVPDSPFTLREGDRVSISIGGIGTLSNTVATA